MLPINEHNKNVMSTSGALPPTEVRSIAIPADISQAALGNPQVNASKKISATSLSIPVPSFDKFKKEESRLIKYLDLADSLDQDENGTQKILDNMVPAVIEEIVQAGYAESDSVTENYLDFDAKGTSPFVLNDELIKHPGFEIGIVGLNIASRASSTLGLKLLLNKIQETISAKKSILQYVKDERELEVLNREINILTNWLTIHSDLFSEMLKETVMESTFSLPKAASAFIALADVAGALEKVIDWIGAGVGLICNAIVFHLKRKDFDEHEIWTQILHDKSVEVNSIVKRQQEIFQNRKQSNLPELEKLLESINLDLEKAKNATENDREQAVNEAVKQLEDVGIIFPETTFTVEELQKALSNPIDKDAMNTMMVKKKEMLAASVKNALQTLLEKKDKIDRGFLINAEGKALFFLGYSIQMTLATIVLQTLFYTGVLATISVFSSLGYGGLVLLFGSMGLGAYYLNKKKPNTFKTYIQGVQARLAFWSIPLSIQRFRRNCVLLENIQVGEEIKGIWYRIHTVDRLLKSGSDIEGLANYRQRLEKDVQNKKAELKSLDEKVKGLNESINNLEERIKPLQERIEEAGVNDFLIKLHEGNDLKDTEIEMSYIPKGKSTKSKDDLQVLEEYLGDKNLRKDPVIDKILMHIGINQNDEFLKEFRAFIAMETHDKLDFIKTQNRLEENGLQANTANN